MINVSKQNGFALISALVVLAIVTGATVAMVVKQTNGIELATNIIRYNQINNYSDGILLWAEGVLFDDIKENNTDSAQDIWNQPLVDVEIEGGQIDARIIDLQSKFNINNLILSGEEGELARARFRRLLTILSVSTDFTDALADWIDADSETRFPNGAEDEYYLSKDTSYRVANQAFVSPYELLLVKGVSLEDFKKIEPFISCLNPGVGININTASDEVLLALSDDMDLSAVESIKNLREQTPITTLKSEQTLPDKSSSEPRVDADEADMSEYCRSLTWTAQRRLCQLRESEEKGGFSKFDNDPDSEVSLQGSVAQSKFEITGLDKASSYFNIQGKVKKYNSEVVFYYTLRRDPNTGNMELLSQKKSSL